jgi:hypothetical protein
MSQQGDENMNCAQLAQQLNENQAGIDALVRKDKKVREENIAKNVAGAVIPGAGLLLIASTDFSNTEQIRARALMDRNQQLNYLAKQKGCKV